MTTALQVQAQIIEELKRAVEKAAEAQGWSLTELPAVTLEVPKEKEHGDYATNLAMQLARAARNAPRKVAEAIVRHFDREATYVDKVEIAGPGFINLFLKPDWLYETLREIISKDFYYGRSNHGQGQKLQVEFVSANPVGPMNVVNARAAAIGDCLARLFSAIGYDVSKEFYVNDAGRQAALFGASLEARARELLGEEVEFPAEGYPAEYVTDLARELLQEKPDFLAMPMEERLDFCKRWGADRVVRWQKEDLARFGVEFDVWFRERDLHAGKAVENTIAYLRDHGFIYEQDGALWFASTRFGDDKDRVLIKSDGEPTYLTADIAYHKNKYDRGFEKVIDILGPDHHGYIGRMKAAVQALGHPEDALEIIILQLVNLLRNGEKVRMSKRKGNFVTMDELVEEVGKDAARYFFLMRSPESHLDFDITLATEQSAENPVYYVQYAHARICSILRQAKEEGIRVPEISESDLLTLVEEVELDLLRKLAAFPEEIHLAATRREPHRIARYVHELASLFHTFYTHCRVIGVDKKLQGARLVLIDGVRIVLRNGLAALGISAPEKM